MTDSTTASRGSIDPRGFTLRRFRADDRSWFSAMAQDPQVTRLIRDGRPWSQELVDRRVETARAADSLWLIAEDGTGAAVALVVAEYCEEEVELGYWVPPEQWGRGLATAVLTRALPLIAVALPRGRLVAHIHPDNTGSVRVVTKLGFTWAGTVDNRFLRFERQRR